MKAKGGFLIEHLKQMDFCRNVDFMLT